MNAIHSRLMLASAAVLVTLAGAACRGSARAERGHDDAAYGDTGRTRRDHDRAADRREHTDSLTDGDIAVTLAVANTLDSAAGAFAQSRAHTPSVRQFAARMVREHGTANRAVTQLVRRLDPNATPHESDDVRDMRQDAERAKTDMARDSGVAFDRKYIDHEVHDHQALLDKIDHDLVPHAQNSQLKQVLTATRAAVNAHLADARRIQDQLKS